MHFIRHLLFMHYAVLDALFTYIVIDHYMPILKPNLRLQVSDAYARAVRLGARRIDLDYKIIIL